MDATTLVTPQELAAILKVPVSWIYQRTRLGPRAIPFIRVGRYVRFDPQQVIAFLKERQARDELGRDLQTSSV